MDLSGAKWHKSLLSGDDGGQCVQVAANLPGLPGVVVMRDSKNPGGPVLVITRAAWTCFLGAIRNGVFDG